MLKKLFLFSIILLLSGCIGSEELLDTVVIAYPRYSKFRKDVTPEDLKISNLIKNNSEASLKIKKYFENAGITLSSVPNEYFIYPKLSIKATEFITPRSHLCIIRNSKKNIRKVIRLLDELSIKFYVLSIADYDPEKFFLNPDYGTNEGLSVFISKELKSRIQFESKDQR